MNETVNNRTSKVDSETFSFSHHVQLEELSESAYLQCVENLELIKKVLKTDN